jgi:hypothetical protein
MIHFKVKKTKTKKRHTDKHGEHHHLNYEIKKVFLSLNTIFTLVGFTVGGILMGRTLWEIFRVSMGLSWTFFVGFLLFGGAGLLSGKFHK